MFSHPIFIFLLLFACLHSFAAEAIVDFADKHCMECHDADTEKGDFSIEAIFEQLQPAGHAELLDKIVRKVETGEMPPKKDEAFFASDETTAFLTAGRADLLAYFEEKKQTGFGGLQRLRSDQYVNTLHDLLGYPFRDIEGHIPTDSPDHRQPGEISYFHFDQYVESAGKVLDYAIGRQQAQKRTYVFNFENAAKVIYWLKADHIRAPMSEERGVMIAGSRAFHSSGHAELYTEPVEEAGLYRIRIKVLAENGPVTYRIAARTTPPVGVVWGIKGSRNLALHDAEPGEFTEVEIEAFVNAGERVAVQKISIDGPISYNHYHKLKEEDKLEGTRNIHFWAHTIEATGPLDKEIVSMRDAILQNQPANREGAAHVLTNLLPRAFRREAPAEEARPFLAVYDRELAKTKSHDQALREALKAMLVSSHFLYRNTNTGPLNDYEIANRLSYFLWNSMPDTELFDLAARGELQKAEVRIAQVERMLGDEKSERFVVDFTNYWLQLHQVAHMRPKVNPGIRFDGTLEEDIRGETRHFFREVLHGDLSVDNFLDSDWSMLNENMAIVYRMQDRGIEGREYRRVTFKPEDRRGGVVGHASFLNLTSFSDATRPIARGVWIIENLMNQPLEPPKGIKPIETDTRGATTILEQIRKHRDAAACRTCHQKIDPFGIALEHYGVAGEWRHTYKGGVAIETKVPEYSDVSGIEGVKELLMEERDEFELQLINKIKEYALGRDITYYDLESSRRIARDHGAGLKTLIEAIVADETFLIR